MKINDTKKAEMIGLIYMNNSLFYFSVDEQQRQRTFANADKNKFDSYINSIDLYSSHAFSIKFFV